MSKPQPEEDYQIFFEDLWREQLGENPTDERDTDNEAAYLRSDQVSALGQDAAELIHEEEQTAEDDEPTIQTQS